MTIHRFAVIPLCLFLSGSLSVLQAATAPKALAAASISVTYAGVYSPGYSYAKGTVVKYGNCTYLALGAVGTNGSPSANPSLWTVFGVLPENNTFGTGSNSFNLDFVTVGNPGNQNDSNGYGKVSYSYQMGTYDISVNQYNAASSNGALGLGDTWFTNGDQPATAMNWYQAAAFVNWLNTSQGYSPAYKLTYSSNTGYSMALWPTNQAWTNGGMNLYRNASCVYFLPSENEWYKAAYYDPTKNNGNGGYWLYPTGSSNAPVAVASGTNTQTAVYNQSWSTSPAPVYQAGGLSPYGTMGQGGNVWQILETAASGVNNSTTLNCTAAGGAWPAGLGALAGGFQNFSTNTRTFQNATAGFRVARILP